MAKRAKVIGIPRVNKRTGKHLKACQCKACTAQRLRAWEQRVDLMFQPREPASPAHLIPVRGYFRRDSRYLKKQPALLELVRLAVKGIIQFHDQTHYTKRGGK